MVAWYARPILIHSRPFDSRARRIGMSSIVKTETLQKLYPNSRLAGGEIRITANTKQAASDSEAKLTRRDSIFPLLDHITTPHTSVSGLKNGAAGSRETIDRAAGKSLQDQGQSLPRAQSSSSIFSSLNPDREEENITGLDEWWHDDFEQRRKQLAEWKTSACKPVEGRDGCVMETRLSDLPPESTVGGIDFPILPGLSDNYISTPDWKWYEEEIAPNEYTWQLEELKGVEAAYGRSHRKVEELTARADRLRAERQRRPTVRKVQRDLNTAEMDLGRVIQELELMGQAVILRRRECASLAPLEHASANGTKPIRIAQS